MDSNLEPLCEAMVLIAATAVIKIHASDKLIIEVFLY